MASFLEIKTEAKRKVVEREWLPGQLIPNEDDIAKDLSCSRATVNRALRELAEEGLLERKRKAGTRVVLHPERKATLSIPVIRLEIQNRGCAYSYCLLQISKKVPPQTLIKKWACQDRRKMLHLKALHLADNAPYVLEDRWINLNSVPAAAATDYSVQSANEWLVQNTPFSHGDITLHAASASKKEAEILTVAAGTALFIVERTTWNQHQPMTTVRLSYAPGYRMQTTV